MEAFSFRSSGAALFFPLGEGMFRSSSDMGVPISPDAVRDVPLVWRPLLTSPLLSLSSPMALDKVHEPASWFIPDPMNLREEGLNT